MSALRSYRVRHRWEETECQQCGEPIDQGEIAYTDHPDICSYIACSKTCARIITS